MQEKEKVETFDELIEASGMKYEHIASQLGITSNYLWRLRKEPMNIETDMIEKVAAVINVPVERVYESIRATR